MQKKSSRIRDESMINIKVKHKTGNIIRIIQEAVINKQKLVKHRERKHGNKGLAGINYSNQDQCFAPVFVCVCVFGGV